MNFKSINTEVGEKKRYIFVDILRIVSIMGVVLIHITTTVVTSSGTVDFGSWTTALFLNSYSRWPTLVFIMVSGYLLLNSSKVGNVKEFYKRRLDKILIPLVFWFTFYYF